MRQVHITRDFTVKGEREGCSALGVVSREELIFPPLHKLEIQLAATRRGRPLSDSD
jgi:hypothetical protein